MARGAQPLHAEDNVGRFPARTLLSEQVTSETQEPIANAESAAPPTPTVAPPPITHSLNDTRMYGWPGSEEGFAFPQHRPPPSHVADHIEAGSWFIHTDPDDPGRHIGLGEPLMGTSWLNRPHYTALLVGSMIADDMRGNAELHNDLFMGLHQGWDFDHYHGAEFRIAGGTYGVYDSPTDSNGDITFADAHLLHYPWGDALWRPYYSLGLGLAQHHVRDNAGRVHDEVLINFPLGIGLKYQWQRHCAMRFDIKHNINFGGGGLDAMDHVSLSYGFEYRYGGQPKSYFPWNPSVHLE